jgi:hypothetical protein
MKKQFLGSKGTFRADDMSSIHEWDVMISGYLMRRVANKVSL